MPIAYHVGFIRLSATTARLVIRTNRDAMPPDLTRYLDVWVNDPTPLTPPARAAWRDYINTYPNCHFRRLLIDSQKE